MLKIDKMHENFAPKFLNNVNKANSPKRPATFLLDPGLEQFLVYMIVGP